jgi:hypothetical protein
MNTCPQRSIETAHGYIFGLLFLFYGIILTAVYAYFVKESLTFITGDTFFSALLRFVFEAVSVFLILVISYRIVHFMRRLKVFDYLIFYTSFTRFKFWRRYKAPTKLTY